MSPQEIEALVEEKVREAFNRRDSKAIHHSRITPGLIKARHLFDKAVVFGSGDRPTNADTGVKVHFDTSTGVLSCWDGSSWLETTLS